MSRIRVLAFFCGFLLGLAMAEVTPYFLLAMFLLIGMALVAVNIYILLCAIG